MNAGQVQLGGRVSPRAGEDSPRPLPPKTYTTAPPPPAEPDKATVAAQVALLEEAVAWRGAGAKAGAAGQQGV